MGIWSQKDITIDYANNDWYADIYYYHINQQSSVVSHLRHAVTKKQAQDYRYDSLTKRLLWQIGRY